MTREEAISVLKVLASFQGVMEYLEQHSVSVQDACNMAIKALGQQPCEDVISRKAVFNAIEQEDKWLLSAKGHNGLTEIAFSGLKARVDALPSVTQKSGKWVEIDDEPHEVWECDHCGFVIDGSGCIEPYEYRDTYKFCPNCGCRMVEPQERSE